jgi:hypothetical protein
MIKRLADHATTHRSWNGRDDIHGHYVGRVPLSEHSVSISLTWKREKDSKPCPVGRFLLDMPALETRGFVRKVEGYYILRFQRAGNLIEVAPNRSGPSHPLGRLPGDY